MDQDIKILNDEQIRNLPLFFKIIYHNKLTDKNLEDMLMRTDSVTGCRVIRNARPTRPFALFSGDYIISEDKPHDKK